LVANKADLDPEITKKKFLFAHENGMETLFTSASSGMNVVRLFHNAIEMAINHKNNGKSDLDKELEDLLKDDEFWDGEEIQVWSNINN